MVIFLLVQSETQLRSGLPWLTLFAENNHCRLHVIVVASEGETLAQHAKQMSEDIPGFLAVAQVEPDVSAVVRQLRSLRCDTLLIIDDGHADPFQKTMFLASPFQTVWLRPRRDPDHASHALFSLEQEPSALVCRSATELLGKRPSLHLVDRSQSNLEGDDSDPGNDSVSNEDLRSANASHADRWVQQCLAAERQRCDLGDLIWIECGEADNTPNYLAARVLMGHDGNASVALVRSGETLMESWTASVRHWASHVAEPMDRDQRKELAASLAEGSKPNLEFLGLISASSMLAAFGLLQDSAAVIIGAMLVAPLMTPILGAGLALTHGNRPMFRSAVLTITIGFVGALVSSFLFGCLVRLIEEPKMTAEMWARCQPSPLDFCVGLVGGMAASYARTRSHLSSALAGAAIAAALVPPIATAGLQLAFGTVSSDASRGTPVIGPIMLVTANVLTIMIGSSFVLSLRGMRVDRQFSASERWATRMTVALVTLVLMVLVWIVQPTLGFE